MIRRKKKTHCKYGHEFTQENTYTRERVRNGKHHVDRACRACGREAMRKKLGLKQYRMVGAALSRQEEYALRMKQLQETGKMTCSKCKETQSEDQFLIYRRSEDGRSFRYRARCRTCDSKVSTEWYFKNRTKILRRDKIRKGENNYQAAVYGLTPGQYDEMLIAQNEVCAICGEKEKVTRLKRLAIDHDHATEKVRELLCNRCNNVLGRVDDKIALLEKAIQYLKKHNEIHELEQMVTL